MTPERIISCARQIILLPRNISRFRAKGAVFFAMDAAQPRMRRYRIAVLAQRSERLAAMLDSAIKNAGASAEVSAYDGGECDILAAFDTRLPIRRVSPPEGCVPIIYSGSGRVRRALAGCALPCVSCGTSPYDTVTVSSISRGRAMLTVQREISPLCGGVIEPCELPVRYYGCDIYKALLCSAAVIMCAGIPAEGELVISPGPR